MKEKQIVAAFREVGATSSAAAVTPATIGVDEQLAFKILQRRAVLREAKPGQFYLDEPSWEAARSVRRRVLLLVLVLMLVAALAYFSRR